MLKGPPTDAPGREHSRSINAASAAGAPSKYRLWNHWFPKLIESRGRELTELFVPTDGPDDWRQCNERHGLPRNGHAGRHPLSAAPMAAVVAKGPPGALTPAVNCTADGINAYCRPPTPRSKPFTYRLPEQTVHCPPDPRHWQYGKLLRGAAPRRSLLLGSHHAIEVENLSVSRIEHIIARGCCISYGINQTTTIMIHAVVRQAG